MINLIKINTTEEISKAVKNYCLFLSDNTRIDTCETIEYAIEHNDFHMREDDYNECFKETPFNPKETTDAFSGLDKCAEELTKCGKETHIPEEPYIEVSDKLKEYITKDKEPCHWCNGTGIDPYTNQNNMPCANCNESGVE